MNTSKQTPSPQPNVRASQAADAYVTEQGLEHSGGIIERAFEAGALWTTKASSDQPDDSPSPQPTSTLSPHIEGENDGGGR